MSNTSTTESARVVKGAALLETTDSQTAVRDARHEALEVLIGKWINEGHAIATPGSPSVPILTSDAYEWAPGGFFVIQPAYGKMGETTVGGGAIIGVDGDASHSTFYDSFGNAQSSCMEIDGG